ncbi:hypothetical protein C8J57DRAFT_1608640 [Mycena rebaudengoi]|nr:hypothetical protein C8J57DRAFT_1608640 [Mycena rebaudengoi]
MFLLGIAQVMVEQKAGSGELTISADGAPSLAGRSDSLHPIVDARLAGARADVLLPAPLAAQLRLLRLARAHLLVVVPAVLARQADALGGIRGGRRRLLWRERRRPGRLLLAVQIPPLTARAPGAGPAGIRAQKVCSGVWVGGTYFSQRVRARRQGSPGNIPQTPVGGMYTPPIQTPYKQRVRRVPSSGAGSFLGTPPGSPGCAQDETPSRVPPWAAEQPRLQALAVGDASVSRTPTPNLDLQGVQAQIDSAHYHAAQAAKETLLQIFPSVDLEVVQWVLEANEGDLGRSIEALLEMSSGE